MQSRAAVLLKLAQENKKYKENKPFSANVNKRLDDTQNQFNKRVCRSSQSGIYIFSTILYLFFDINYFQEFCHNKK